MPRQKKQIEFNEEVVYGQAEKLLGDNSNALRAMANYAFEQRKSREAMRVLSFVWMRNARMLARAVCRWPKWFMEVDGEPPIEGSADEYLALFYMAALPLAESLELYAKWRRYTWIAWQVKEKIQEFREARNQNKGKRARLKKAWVEESGPNSIIISFRGDEQKDWKPEEWDGEEELEVTLSKPEKSK